MNYFFYLIDKIKQYYRVKNANLIFTRLFIQTPGHALSLTARQKTGTDQIAWFYGEIDFDGFYKILQFIQPKPDEIFYDLGTGLGKPLAVAALLYPFKKCVGIELFSDLTDPAQAIMQTLIQTHQNALPNPNIEIKIVQQDFLSSDFSEADLVFINATCYINETLQQITQQLEKQLHLGAKVIITTQKPELPGFKLLHRNVFMMGWGESMVSIYEKTV